MIQLELFEEQDMSTLQVSDNTAAAAVEIIFLETVVNSLTDSYPESQELSLAITKIVEAIMWLKKVEK